MRSSWKKRKKKFLAYRKPTPICLLWAQCKPESNWLHLQPKTGIQDNRYQANIYVSSLSGIFRITVHSYRIWIPFDKKPFSVFLTSFCDGFPFTLVNFGLFSGFVPCGSTYYKNAWPLHQGNFWTISIAWLLLQFRPLQC